MKKKKLMKKLYSIIPLAILVIYSLLNMWKVGTIYPIYQNYLMKQAIWFGVGFFILIIFTFFKPKFLFQYSKTFYFMNVFLLILVLFVGKTINGSRAWFSFGIFSFQPSELMKFTLALYLSQELSKIQKDPKLEFKVILKGLFLTFIPSLFVFLEPDTGAIIIYLLIFLGVIIAYRIRPKWYFIFGGILVIILLLFGYFYLFQKDLLIKLIGTSFFYRVDRLLTFVNQDSFQLDRALISIGSSSLLGANRPLYIPEAPTDFIIALTISQYGVISFLIILLAFFFLDGYFLKEYFDLKNVKYKMFTSAFLFMFLFAQIENIGMNLGLLPIIGLPLPFLSYGGTNIIVYFLFLGVLFHIKQN